ncbi:unnamed protein product [Echinostoma caproni]|uniref:Uncharacterized protein n=1 Tax=Echinostoma caproni TaxID=27848 RepID=A0A3P8KXJ6_9TREM|nr:unnamed protein product [Echinostoma caproni]
MDTHYKMLVKNARAVKNKDALTGKNGIVDHPSGNTTPTRKQTSIRETEPNNAQAPSEDRSFTLQFDSVQKSSTELADKTSHAEWLSAPLLGDKIETPQRAVMNSTTEQTASESDAPTEYRELVHSKQSSVQMSQKRHSLLHGGTVSSHSTSVQTDTNGAATASSQRDWTLQHCASLTEADRRLTWLQNKLRQSLLADDILLKNSPTVKTQRQCSGSKRSTSLLYSPKQTPVTIKDTNPTSTKPVPVLPPLPPNTDARPVSKTPEVSELCVGLSSPPNKENPPETLLSVYPQVGVSPSDSRREENATTPNLPQAAENVVSSCLSCGDANLKPRVQIAPNTNRCDGALLESGQLKPQSVTSDEIKLGINVSLNHLAEERSRLQRKILRLKVIYKSYKERLASLDTSLMLLQQSSATTTNYFLPSKVNGVTQASTIKTPLSRTNHSALDDGSVSSESSSTCRTPVLHAKPEIIDIQEHPDPFADYRPRRSLSAPRHTPASVRRHQPSRFLSGSPALRRSVSQELAASLASIDSQLHRVLCQLDPNSPNCPHNVYDDDDENENNDPLLLSDHKRTPAQCHRHHKPVVSFSTRFLQHGLANLSLSDHCSRTSALGDLHILTPVSPDEMQNRSFQKPRVNASPTCLQSD